MDTKQKNIRFTSKRRKFLLIIAVLATFISASVYFFINFLLLIKFSAIEKLMAAPFFNETYKQLSEATLFNYYINISVSLITFFSLILMLNRKKTGFYFYFFTRVLLLANITLLNKSFTPSLSSYTQVSLALIFSVWMILVYSFLTSKKSKPNTDEVIAVEPEQTNTTFV